MHRFSALALLGAALAVGGCGSSSTLGVVRVLYAGSLEKVMNTRIAPAFEHATGYTLDGYPAGSNELANEIRGRVRQGDVFISASPQINATLEGVANGDWLSWYAPFASTALVLGYNAGSSFARALRTEPWYRVITRPGFRLGSTDPALDPKGALSVKALSETAALQQLPALNRLAANRSGVFPEEDLVGRLESGQLDAGFFYTVEASAAGLPTVPLAPVEESTTYTITILRRAPDAAGAAKFVRFLLGARGQALLRSAGLKLIPARATGTGVPGGLRVLH